MCSLCCTEWMAAAAAAAVQTADMTQHFLMSPTLSLSEPNRFQSLTLHNFLYEKVSLINTVHIFIVCFRRHLNKKYWPVRSKKPNYNKIKIYIKTILCNCFNNRRRPCSKHILAHTSVFGYYFNFFNESKMA